MRVQEILLHTYVIPTANDVLTVANEKESKT